MKISQKKEVENLEVTYNSPKSIAIDGSHQITTKRTELGVF